MRCRSFALPCNQCIVCFLLNIILKIMHGTVLTSCMHMKVMSLCNIVIVSVRRGGGGGFLLEGEKFS